MRKEYNKILMVLILIVFIVFAISSCDRNSIENEEEISISPDKVNITNFYAYRYLDQHTISGKILNESGSGTVKIEIYATFFGKIGDPRQRISTYGPFALESGAVHPFEETYTLTYDNRNFVIEVYVLDNGEWKIADEESDSTADI